MFYGFVITEAGNSLLASMVAGQTLTITKAVVGEGTADNAEAARKLTNLIDPGPEGTSTVPTVEENSVNMIVEYRSDLNGGLQQGFWIGEFGIFGKVGTGAETLIGYGSLGDAKQYVSAYVSGTAPDVRRYPVSITVTTGIQVDVAYPAEAWMTAEDVADLFNQTLKPELEESLNGLIEDHNEDPDAHQGALKNKQDQIKVEGLLKGSKTTTEEGETYNVGGGHAGHRLPGAHQHPGGGGEHDHAGPDPVLRRHRRPAQADHAAGAERGHRRTKPHHFRDDLHGGVRDLFGRSGNNPAGYGFDGL